MRLISLLILAVLLVPPAWAEPRVLRHSFGTTLIEGTPKRVVSLSFVGHDFLLSLGVVPIALRYWYGGHEHGVFPWGEQLLGDAEPVLLHGEINIEQIALLKPDLIVGQWSGMSAQQYHLLSKIAPTLPPAEGEVLYSSSWQTMTRQLGRALDRDARAEAIIARLEGRFAEVRAAHPDWKGKSSAVVWSPRLTAYTSLDLRSRFLGDLGFEAPRAIDALVKSNAFLVPLPQEDLSALDVDLLMWTHAQNLGESLDEIVLRKSLRVYREGRELYTDYDLTAALAHSSPLSLDYALDRMIPLIEAAMDGDPATPVATMQAEGVAP